MDPKYELDLDCTDNNRELPEAIRPDCTLDPPTFETLDAKAETTEEVTARWKAEDEEAKRSHFLRGSNGEQMVPIIALEPDVNRVPRHRFACISVIKPEMYETLHHGSRKYKGLLMKVRGVFETREAADAWIRERIIPLDPHFDVHLIECHKWSGVEDDDVHDREYTDEKINTIMTSYFKEEHDKQLGLQTRVEVAKNMVQRSKESGDFYREANKHGVDVPGEVPERMSRRATMPHEQLVDLPSTARPVSLDMLRQKVMAGYVPRQSMINAINDESVAATRREEEEEDSCSDDELMRPVPRRNATILSTFLDK